MRLAAISLVDHIAIDLEEKFKGLDSVMILPFHTEYLDIIHGVTYVLIIARSIQHSWAI